MQIYTDVGDGIPMRDRDSSAGRVLILFCALFTWRQSQQNVQIHVLFNIYFVVGLNDSGSLSDTSVRNVLHRMPPCQTSRAFI